MNGGGLLAILGVIVVMLLIVVVFYAVRLVRASRQATDTAARFREFMRNQAQVESILAAPGPTSKASLEATSSPPSPIAVPVTAVGYSGVLPPPSELVLADVHLRLSEITDDPIYLARDASGAVVVQLGTRQPLPLAYVLDLRARQVLQTVVGQATVKFGQVWSILASDDPEGNLALRRLS